MRICEYACPQNKNQQIRVQIPKDIRQAATHYNTLQHTAINTIIRYNTPWAKHICTKRLCFAFMKLQCFFVWQHTATYCNTLQHTKTLHHSATLCNTLQHTATHCNTLQHTAKHCKTLWAKHIHTRLLFLAFMNPQISFAANVFVSQIVKSTPSFQPWCSK